MTVTLELAPDLRLQLEQAAELSGRDVLDLVQHILRQALEESSLLRPDLIPEDDEPFTEEDQAAVTAGRADRTAGRVFSTDEMRGRRRSRP